MSRTTDKLRAQAESQGWTVTSIEYEPMGTGAEMEGPSGGWQVWMTKNGAEDVAMGFNVHQVIRWMKNLDKIDGGWLGEGNDPFGCPQSDCHFARGYRGQHIAPHALTGEAR